MNAWTQLSAAALAVAAFAAPTWAQSPNQLSDTQLDAVAAGSSNNGQQQGGIFRSVTSSVSQFGIGNMNGDGNTNAILSGNSVANGNNVSVLSGNRTENNVGSGNSFSRRSTTTTNRSESMHVSARAGNWNASAGNKH